ncbi:MAG: hypothetical protein ACSLFE_10245 [Gemmatimonadaceae bacterium]
MATNGFVASGQKAQPIVQGAQVSAPFGKVELALDVFKDSTVAEPSGTP